MNKVLKTNVKTRIVEHGVPDDKALEFAAAAAKVSLKKNKYLMDTIIELEQLVIGKVFTDATEDICNDCVQKHWDKYFNPILDLVLEAIDEARTEWLDNDIKQNKK